MPADPYLSEARQAERAENAERWVGYMKAVLRGEITVDRNIGKEIQADAL